MAQAPSHPKHPAATSTMRLKLAPTGRALEHDRMIRACLERRHHLKRNDFPHLCQNVQQASWNIGKSEAVRQGKVFPHKIGAVALVQRRKNRMVALWTMHDFNQIAQKDKKDLRIMHANST